jgi:hypothetical protein
VSDVEHELLLENTEQVQELARLRELLLRVTRVAVDAQDRVDGRHDAFLDALLDELVAG